MHACVRACREDSAVLPPPSAGGELPEQRGLGWDYWEQQQQQSEGPPASAATQQQEGSEWGSTQAQQAAARLLQLGASVTPPGKKSAVDWDALAGAPARASPCSGIHPHAR